MPRPRKEATSQAELLCALNAGGVQWLLVTLWLHQIGWRHPFLLGWLVVLGLHEVVDWIARAAASLLEMAVTAQRHEVDSGQGP